MVISWWLIERLPSMCSAEAPKEEGGAAAPAEPEASGEAGGDDEDEEVAGESTSQDGGGGDIFQANKSTCWRGADHVLFVLSGLLKS